MRGRHAGWYNQIKIENDGVKNDRFEYNHAKIESIWIIVFGTRWSTSQEIGSCTRYLVLKCRQVGSIDPFWNIYRVLGIKMSIS